MTELTLFVDPYEANLPAPISELLNQKLGSPVYVTITPDNYCLFLCNNYIYFFYNEPVKTAMRTVKFKIPGHSNHQYTTNTICLFQHRNSPANCPYLIAVSHDGIVRCWSDTNKPHHQVNLELRSNDFPTNLCLIESHEHVHRFLISTTTFSMFYVVEIFHKKPSQSDNLTFHSLDLSISTGIGRRMTNLFFNTFSSEKETLVKTLPVSGRIRSSLVDVITIFPHVFRLISVRNQQLIQEINIADAFVAHMRSNDKKINVSQVNVVDADIYQHGLLMLIAVVDHNSSEPRFISVNFYLGFMKEKHADIGEYVNSFIPIILPDTMSNMEESQLTQCRLLVPNNEECAIVLHRSMIAFYQPTSENVEAMILNDINDYVLGAMVVNGLSHVILREHGVCILRRLPYDFDLTYWRKNRDHLIKASEDTTFSDDYLKKGFIAFCSKDLKEAKKWADKLVKRTNVNVAELAVEFDQFFIDHRPDDPRWTMNKNNTNENKSQKIIEQLAIKLSHHNMFILFLQKYNLLKKVDQPITSMGGRTGTALLAELGEKLIVAMLFNNSMCNKATKEGMPSLIVESIRTLSAEFIRRFQHLESAELTNCDHVFCEVSHFGELIAMIVTIAERKLKSVSDIIERLKMLLQVGDALAIVAKGVEKAKIENAALIAMNTDGANVASSGWLQHLLIYFIRHFNAAMDILEAANGEHTEELSDLVISNCSQIARFVLGQQNKWQRDKSQIIARFMVLGHTKLAIELAEEFYDFSTIIEYCHNTMREARCTEALNHYKEMFAENNFDLFLYDYYRKNGMVNRLLAEKSSRLNEFLASYEIINWIRNIENCQYAQAYHTLKNMAATTNNLDKKMVELSLAKLCLLSQSDEERDVGELTEISGEIRRIITEYEQKNYDEGDSPDSVA